MSSLLRLLDSLAEDFLLYLAMLVFFWGTSGTRGVTAVADVPVFAWACLITGIFLVLCEIGIRVAKIEKRSRK